MNPLPKDILILLEQNHAPLLLIRHLTLVYNTGKELLNKLTMVWPNLTIAEDEVLFGSATHDIGKIVELKELTESGNAHEKAGHHFLIGIGVTENLARFAKTHGNWEETDLKLEDLLVTLV